MSPLPTGTLTLLFSDIEGSTSLLRGLGESWGEALSTQRRIMRDVFAEFRGQELGTEGDSFFVVFESAHNAVMAAVTAQRRLHEQEWPRDTPVRVRIGLHTGEPERHEDGYIGIDVHRAARIAATAAGGQIVVSATTRALLTDLEEVMVRDLGRHRLKDLPEPEHLFDLMAKGLPEDHRPLRSLGTQANLPAYGSELVGRDTEVRELTQLLASGSRLVTLTGPGGTGKTRLAVAVAGAMSEQSSRDLFFVALHAADRAPVMWTGIAEALSAQGVSDELPHERVLRFLRDRDAFLVLDNLEQVTGADEVVADLLNEAPGVVILATSRRPLHLVDEILFPVPTLEVPDPARSGPDDAGRFAAVHLFVQRARMVVRNFALTPSNAADVVALVRRLDGLPLAIELAAARVRLLSPAALLRRLDDRISDEVTTPHRTGRQRTLRATIAWSYDLLEPQDQEVFRCIGVFSSRFDLEAVQAVAGGNEVDPLDTVAHLVDVSLIEITEGPDGEPMLWLLDTIRRFARERLADSGAEEAVRLRHARWTLAEAEDIDELLRGPRQMTALDRMDAVDMDIRSALDWCLSAEASSWDERQDVGFTLLGAMTSYWYRFGYIAEGRGWHERALAIVAAEKVPDNPQVVDALHGQGVLALQQSDFTIALDALERALAIAERLGDGFREARESNSLGVAHRQIGDLAEARSLIERSLTIALRIKDRHREATALSNMVHLHMDAGDYAGAVTASRRAIELDRALDDPWGVAIDQSNLVAALLNAEGPEAAFEALSSVAEDAIALGDTELAIDVIDHCAMVRAALGEPEQAAAILAAADRQREASGIPRQGPDLVGLDQYLGPARERLGQDRWAAAYATGRDWDVETAVREGLRKPVASGG